MLEASDLSSGMSFRMAKISSWVQNFLRLAMVVSSSQLTRGIGDRSKQIACEFEQVQTLVEQ